MGLEDQGNRGVGDQGKGDLWMNRFWYKGIIGIWDWGIRVLWDCGIRATGGLWDLEIEVLGNLEI